MPSLLSYITAPVALTMLFPVPFGNQTSPESAVKLPEEILAIEQDRAQRMTVPVSIEGKGPFSFVIDTGAERTVLATGIAKQLALESEKPARLVSIAGTSMVDMVYVPTLQLGRKSYDGLITPVLAAQHIGADGILGLDGLQDQRIVFDFVKNEIAIEDGARARTSGAEREIIVTARRRSGQLIFTDATISGVKVNVIVDTGAQMSIGNLALKQRLLKRAQQTGDNNMLIAVTGATLGVEVATVRNVTMGRAQFSSMAVAFADAPPFERFGMGDKPALLLGMDVLRKFDRVAIDFGARKIYFTPPKDAAEHFERATSGRIKS